MRVLRLDYEVCVCVCVLVCVCVCEIVGKPYQTLSSIV